MEEQSLRDEKDLDNDARALDRLRRFGGDKLLGEMIELFLSIAPERVAAARRALEAGDLPTSERAMHSLKGSAAQLGALRLERLSERGERLTRLGTLVDMPILMRELDEEIPRVREWLIKARDEGSA
jgi:HPt (histidine-containing phosphotransfer) domain-containing protein